jgi:polyphenol oxidase
VFCFRDSRGLVDVAFTDRHGGTSAAPFDSLNLGSARFDPQVGANVALVADALGTTPEELLTMNQVHGADVVVRDTATGHDRPSADGMVTDRPDLTLAVRVADCVPVLLADPAAGVVGCAHAGRSGLVAGVVPATVGRMRELGAQSVVAWIGPHVCGACYEVPARLQSDVADVVPEARSTTSWGTPALDIGAGVRAQLGSARCEVVDAARCTRESADLYSYRRDGLGAGRFAGLIRLVAPV